MSRCLRLSVLLSLSFPILAAAVSPSALTWPEVRVENKPWTRWWWPGSAVTKPGLTHQLEALAQSGLGGVEITPIYGAIGSEDRYIPYLSPEWMEMLRYTGQEAKRLDMKVDMATGTGWPFGGPWSAPTDGSQKVTLHDGHLTGEPTKMKVKRAAPGGEGLVIDPYSPEALQHYLAPFSKAFADFPRGLVRAQFHDSFEYYEATWTPRLPEVFRTMHGYDIDDYAQELLGKKQIDPESLGRIKSDYRETLAQLHLDYISTWVAWSHAHGFLVRNQSHGAPANLLDLYGTVDIPETEVFGSTPFPIPGLRRDPDEVRSGQDLPEPLVLQMASSAAHVMGHPLASSETCTWLREHWKVTLSDAKPEIDRLFVNGINHIFYHGTVFSPSEAAWPGWFFYASTQFNPNNTWWQDFSSLNAYVARVQSLLQAGQPDNDILLYWPFSDVIDQPDGLMKQLAVHDVKWLTDSPMGQLATQLTAKGYSYDYISDAQLIATAAEGKALRTPGHRYQVLIVPSARRMPLRTLQHLVKLAEQGAPIIFEELPVDVPGNGRLTERRADFRKLLASESLHSTGSIAGVMAALSAHHIRREPLVESGLRLIRRKSDGGHDYFISNLTGQAFHGWFKLGTPARSVVWMDALSGETGYAALRQGKEQPELYLQLEPGQSRLLRALDASSDPVENQTWKDYTPDLTRQKSINGTWHLTFIKGGPTLPAPREMEELKSWTDFGDSEADRFGGTARYSIEFDGPTQPADDWLLDLGDVRESARVRLNGQDVGTAWSLPFRLKIGRYLKPGRNTLEIEVTNLAANRIRDLDRRGVKWKIMHEINLVNIRYQPFDASQWKLMPSGLLGPVVLVPLQTVKPQS